ncbi:MAG: SH3 domain-containing protein [Brevundimonas sp.]|uniref:SH3 domain-containing protein n=1 Tax=Brevundimonas sp. TaxID=1871086 RepID=UPI00391DDC35
MSKMKTISKAVMAATIAGALSVPAVASAQYYGQTQQRPGVFNCPAEGGRQQAGAAIGAVVGGLLGSQISRNERTLGAVGGAAAGAAAGSYIGCQQQINRQGSYNSGYYNGYHNANIYVAQSNLRVRSGPSTRYGQIGTLRAGQQFEAVGFENGWIRLSNGGWVSGSYAARAY